MNKLVSILLFPLIWVGMYLYRIIVLSFLVPLVKFFKHVGSLEFYLALITLLLIPFHLLLDIFISVLISLKAVIEIIKKSFDSNSYLPSDIKEVFLNYNVSTFDMFQRR